MESQEFYEFIYQLTKLLEIYKLTAAGRIDLWLGKKLQAVGKIEFDSGNIKANYLSTKDYGD